MDELTVATTHPQAVEAHLPDDVTIRHWLAFYAAFVLAVGVPLAIFISQAPWSWSAWVSNPQETFADTGWQIKVLGFALFLSLCCTFLPLPTGWLVAAVATREAAVTGELWTTVLVVATAGAAGSTIANLNDYHLFTWMLRHRHVARVRETRAHRAALRWFATCPFWLLVVFNVIPIPVDVVRMLATTYRYPRRRFAGANFVGRFVRYGAIAFLTYRWNLGPAAVVTLLRLAAVLRAARLLPALFRRLLGRGSGGAAVDAGAVRSARQE